MHRTVLSVAYPLVPVTPDTAGGAEQILSILDRKIVERGGRSLVIAAEGSRVCGELIASQGWSGPINARVRARAAAEHRRLVNQVVRDSRVDVVHLHGLDFAEYLPEEGVPCLATLHLPPEWYPASIFSRPRAGLLYTCVSGSQRRACPPSAIPIRAIDDGIDVESFPAPARKRNYALALGRICAEKGFHFAIRAAERARVPLIIAGRVFPYEAHQRYFQLEIAPRMNQCVRFVGPAGFRKKRHLLSCARCLLVPSTVAETSSLVAMEAAASGTPVIAFRSGALPEIVEHGRTGFIVADEHEMAEAIGRVDELSPHECRAVAEERFSAARMATEYFRLYEEMSPVVGEVIENRTSRPAA
jgi:glycosyltransferase involved in cell wall biosynthesis